ncbi:MULTISPECIES: hypothetical protein [unclassified Microbacterium]|uniref:hypothetical protein n=1 Tax=unclassified Microbacterium TaxID=2609290 RepID=UPI00214BCFD0|nr:MULTISPECIES: hypothetical protein [unclassified Microbacterium]MCR2808648.1 hypothetical protein [Microbacterium sp. zg.B185]WIM18919.1 hypothetical protein QNO12_15245 [Microbacterium sp. zg-B185]
MIAVLRVSGLLLWRHWPALLALYLAGTLGRYVAIEVAGFVGAYSAVAGALLFPLAILSRLVALVAMLLVLRDGMAQLGVIAPIPAGRSERRRAFIDALLAGILPFVAFYAAWGYLREDAAAYFSRLLEINAGLIADEIFGDAQRAGDAAVGELSFGPVTIAIIVAAFTGRWLWKRYRGRVPKAFAAVAVYLEVLWVYLSVTLIADALNTVVAWAQKRQAMVWLADVREWVGGQLAPVAWTWDAAEWFLSELGGIVLLPIAWLAIAGVIYGQAVAPQTLQLGVPVVVRARARFDTLPSRLRARLRDLWADLLSRFQPIGRALLLMWRAGPVLVGSYVLLFTVLLFLDAALELGITRVIGPQELGGFWMVNAPLIFLFVPLVIEPLRVVLVASAYDAVIGRLVSVPVAPPAEEPARPAAMAPVPPAASPEAPQPLVGEPTEEHAPR